MSDGARMREKWTLAQIDGSCRLAVLTFVLSGIGWLLLGSLLALVASLKMHWPGLLGEAEWLTFGRVRPAHLNTMIYGWGGMTGIGVVLWLQARMSRVELVFPRILTAMAVVWNLVVLAGTVAILAGYSTSVEWLEFPLWVSILLALLFGVFGVVSFYTFAGRRNDHIYISQWYIFGAILWFPYLYLVANVMIHRGGTTGVVQASANWWFAHNVLGLWLTPIGLAIIYYLIPKVIGRPIHSYYLSILGFWTLALFYNWAGTHHLIGGPLPAWVVTVGIVGSMMMFIPVVTVAINHHMTMVGSFHILKTSPVLRFIVFGGMSYTLVSVQGSLQSLRTWNEVTHFTHYTIAHAHLGVYAFYTMALFGAVYYMVPRLTGLEWASGRLMRVHFWTVALGMILYWAGLTAGGGIQGWQMMSAEMPFLDIVKFTVPFLVSRSVAGVLMTIGHAAFGVLVLVMVWQYWRNWPTDAGAAEADS